MVNQIFVSLSMREVEARIQEYILQNKLTVDIKDTIVLMAPEEKKCIVLVYKKYYMDIASYISMALVLDDFDSVTRISFSVGSQGSIRDKRAEVYFFSQFTKALKGHIIQREN
jgi:hypothetical protein